MSDDVPEDNDKPEEGEEAGGGGAEGGVPWTIAEIRVMLAQLEGRVMTSEARTDAGLSEMKAYVAESRAAAAESKTAVAEFRADADKRESRLVKWMVGVVAVATGIIVAGMTALTLFVPSIGN